MINLLLQLAAEQTMLPTVTPSDILFLAIAYTPQQKANTCPADYHLFQVEVVTASAYFFPWFQALFIWLQCVDLSALMP